MMHEDNQWEDSRNSRDSRFFQLPIYIDLDGKTVEQACEEIRKAFLQSLEAHSQIYPGKFSYKTEPKIDMEYYSDSSPEYSIVFTRTTTEEEKREWDRRAPQVQDAKRVKKMEEIARVEKHLLALKADPIVNG